MNDKHYKIILLKGVENWNKWREENHFTPDLSRADLSGVFLSSANLGSVDLNGVNLSYANLEEANLENANLSGANLSMANLRFANLIHADLSGANLSGAKLNDANLNYANLNCANLSDANLGDSNLNYAILSGAKLNKAGFSNTNLSGANLIGANLILADLTCSNLTGAYLKNANFKLAVLIETLFCNVDLSATKNLNECNHLGPSIIDIRTLQKSGDLPLEFLRGVGLSDNMIDNYTSFHLEQIIKFYSCFISYSIKDREFAEHIHADLQNTGIRCWLAPEDIEGRKELHYQVNEELRFKGKLLLILSETSINSKWIKSEIEMAKKEEEITKLQKLFPIRLVNLDVLKKWECYDSDTSVDLATDLRESFIPDFSNWKTDHELYKKILANLVTDLKKPEELSSKKK